MSSIGCFFFTENEYVGTLFNSVLQISCFPARMRGMIAYIHDFFFGAFLSIWAPWAWIMVNAWYLNIYMKNILWNYKLHIFAVIVIFGWIIGVINFPTITALIIIVITRRCWRHQFPPSLLQFPKSLLTCPLSLNCAANLSESTFTTLYHQNFLSSDCDSVFVFCHYNQACVNAVLPNFPSSPHH